MNKKTAKKLLTCAADLLEKPGAWTQKQNAREANGIVVFPTDPDAVCFCSFGAMIKCMPAATEFKYAAVALGFPSVADLIVWNDKPNRTQTEVVAAFRTAAAKL